MSAFLEMAEEPQLPSIFPVPSVPKSIVSRRLGKGSGDMANLIVSQIDSTAFRLVNCKTARDFLELRKELFPKYAKLSLALANIVNVEDRDRAVLADLAVDAFAEFERTFRKRGTAVLGASHYREALFSLSTLRRTYKLLNRILTTPVPEQSQPEDRRIAAEFNYWILWSQLHLDCLLMGFRRTTNVKPAKEIVSEILDGFRAAVMAYSCARRGAQLREFPKHLDFSGVTWDEEDRRLAEESTTERETTLSEW